MTANNVNLILMIDLRTSQFSSYPVFCFLHCLALVEQMVQTKSPALNPTHTTEIRTESREEGAGNFTTKAVKGLQLLLAPPPVKLWILVHLLTLVLSNVGPNPPLKCTLGSLRVYGMQGGQVRQSQKYLYRDKCCP